MIDMKVVPGQANLLLYLFAFGLGLGISWNTLLLHQHLVAKVINVNKRYAKMKYCT